MENTAAYFEAEANRIEANLANLPGSQSDPSTEYYQAKEQIYEYRVKASALRFASLCEEEKLNTTT